MTGTGDNRVEAGQGSVKIGELSGGEGGDGGGGSGGVHFFFFLDLSFYPAHFTFAAVSFLVLEGRSLLAVGKKFSRIEARAERDRATL